MEKDRLRKEIKSQIELIVYNFNQRINNEIKNGEIENIIDLVEIFDRYTRVQMWLLKQIDKE